MRELTEIKRMPEDEIPWWYIKSNAILAPEEDLRKKVTPEMVIF